MPVSSVILIVLSTSASHVMSPHLAILSTVSLVSWLLRIQFHIGNSGFFSCARMCVCVCAKALGPQQSNCVSNGIISRYPFDAKLFVCSLMMQCTRAKRQKQTQKIILRIVWPLAELSCNKIVIAKSKVLRLPHSDAHTH